MLAGYKTYITAGLAVLGAVAGFLTGEIELSAAAQLAVNALLAAFIRSGIANA
jgi:hypothetical protein